MKLGTGRRMWIFRHTNRIVAQGIDNEREIAFTFITVLRREWCELIMYVNAWSGVVAQKWLNVASWRTGWRVPGRMKSEMAISHSLLASVFACESSHLVPTPDAQKHRENAAHRHAKQ